MKFLPKSCQSAGVGVCVQISSVGGLPGVPCDDCLGSHRLQVRSQLWFDGVTGMVPVVVMDSDANEVCCQVMPECRCCHSCSNFRCWRCWWTLLDGLLCSLLLPAMSELG
jgi:hypothetical protein